MTELPPVPDPVKPPTEMDALRRVLPAPIRCLSDLSVVVPVSLIWLGFQWQGTVRDGASGARLGGELIYGAAVAPVLFTLGAIAWIALRVWSMDRSCWFRPHGVVVTVAAVICCFGSCALHLSKRGFFSIDRVYGAPVTAPGGARYRGYFDLAWSGSDASTVGIARELDRNWVRERVEAVAAADEGRGVPLIRPERRETSQDAGADGVPAIHFDASGRVLAVSADGMCPVAYDPRTRKELSGQGLRTLSPFVLLGTSDTGVDADVSRAEHAIVAAAQQAADPDDPCWGGARESTLLEALGSPNPWIVETAKRLIRAGGPSLYPSATKRL